MRARVLRAADFTRQPWRNGGGFTTELAIEGDADRWLWRVSVAEIERSGPFSDYAGYERTLMLLEGDGMELVFDAAPAKRLDRPHLPFTFDGGWKTECRLLGGRVLDFNLMVDRARAHGAVAVLAAYGGKDFALAADWSLFYCLTGAVGIEVAGARYDVRRGELLRIDGAAGAPAKLTELHPATLVADVRIERR
jgi:uncharacterized protein